MSVHRTSLINSYHAKIGEPRYRDCGDDDFVGEGLCADGECGGVSNACREVEIFHIERFTFFIRFSFEVHDVKILFSFTDVTDSGVIAVDEGNVNGESVVEKERCSYIGVDSKSYVVWKAEEDDIKWKACNRNENRERVVEAFKS